MYPVKLALVALLTALPAFAGPNGAVFCKGSEGKLAMFDIATVTGSRLFSFRGELGTDGPAPFRVAGDLVTNAMTGKTSSVTSQLAEVVYRDSRGELPTLKYEDGTELGQVASVVFHNLSPVRISGNRRDGRVEINLKDALRALEFSGCYYEGGRVDNWFSLWME